MVTNFTIHLKVSRLLIIYQQYGQLPTNERHFPSTSPFHVPLDCADRFLLSLQSWTRWYELCNPTGGLIELRNYPPYNSISHGKIQTKCLPFSLTALFPFHFRSYTSSLANQMYTLWSWLNTNKKINYQQNIWTPRFFISGSLHNHSMRGNLSTIALQWPKTFPFNQTFAHELSYFRILKMHWQQATYFLTTKSPISIFRNLHFFLDLR